MTEKYTFRSKRDPNRVFTVTVSENGIQCDCPGYTFRKKCWHIEEVIKNIINRKTENVGIRRLAEIQVDVRLSNENRYSELIRYLNSFPPFLFIEGSPEEVVHFLKELDADAEVFVLGGVYSYNNLRIETDLNQPASYGKFVQWLREELSKKCKKSRYIVVGIEGFLSGYQEARLLVNFQEELNDLPATVIFVAEDFSQVNQVLLNKGIVYQFPLPDRTEVEYFIKSIDPSLSLEFVNLLTGLRLMDIVNCLALLRASGLESEEEKRELISKFKLSLVKRRGLLESVDTNGVEVGGLRKLKEFCKRLKVSLTQEAKDFGVIPPKRILLVGPPGTGKSLSVKAIAKELGLPCLRLDISSLMSYRYGETVIRTKEAFKIADASAPTVLWLDEIEKMLAAGQGAGDRGHEETLRMMSVVLTYLEEQRDKDVILIGTSNDPTSLRPEMLSRFSSVFFVDLPSQKEREEIIAIHLKRLGHLSKSVNLSEVAKATKDFSGREIRDLCERAVLEAFYRNRPVDTQILLDIVPTIKPISLKMREQVLAIRSWAERFAEPVNDKD
jgi:hypothetical protein